MLKNVQAIFGVPLVAILIGTIVFALPKIIHDNLQTYKEIAHGLSENPLK